MQLVTRRMVDRSVVAYAGAPHGQATGVWTDVEAGSTCQANVSQALLSPAAKHITSTCRAQSSSFEATLSVFINNEF